MAALGYTFIESSLVAPTNVTIRDYGFLAADPAVPAPTEGDHYYLSTINTNRLFDGAAWINTIVSAPAASVDNHLVRWDGVSGAYVQDGATQWTLSDAGLLDGSTGSLVLPQSAGAVPTVSGQTAYDTTAKRLKIGDGAATQTYLPYNPAGEAQGNILYRNATEWVVLAPGTSGFVLKTNGAAANPAWASISSLGGITMGQAVALDGGFASP